jgi:hypothetical protein
LIRDDSNALQEYAERAYSVNSFFFAYLLLEIPFEITASLLFSVVFFAVNLQRTVSMYFLTTIVSICVVNCGESLGIIFNTLIIGGAGLAFTVTMSLMLISCAMSGKCYPFFFPSELTVYISLGLLSIDMPIFLKGLNYGSPIKYALASLTIKTFTDFEFTCTDAQKLPDGSCPVQTGRQVLDLLNYRMSLASNLSGLVAVTVGYRLIAYAVLRLSKADFGVAKKDSGPRSEEVEVGINIE